jgi:urease beta subunit
MIPGEYFIEKGDIECNVGDRTVTLTAVNTGDRPIQIGSHFHFFEVNLMMSFDREKAFGMHLNIAAGTAVRFEPGEEKEIELVEIGGAKRVFGFNNLVNGDTSWEGSKQASLKKVKENNFKNVNDEPENK